MTLARYLVDEIAVGVFQGDDNLEGNATYAAPVVILARVEEILDRVIRSDGTIVNISTWIATNQLDIGPRDRIWVAPSAGPGTPRKFPNGYVYLDSASRSPAALTRARRRTGGNGFTEVKL